jgi:hypothetical protein
VPINLLEPPPRPAASVEELPPKPRQLRIEWTTTCFECSIANATARVEPLVDLLIAAPARLRVNEAAPGACRIELFCTLGCLCRATAAPVGRAP